VPSGVLALHPNAARKGIFWIHYVGVNLACFIGDDIPFHFVLLTNDVLASLGDDPTYPQIAACLMHKILKTQPEGPYSLGGYCAGGVLAYEIACQLKAAGHEVSLLSMVDAMNPSRLREGTSPARIFNMVCHFLGAVARLDQKSLNLTWRDLRGQFGLAKPRQFAGPEVKAAIDLVQRTYLQYQPEKKYDGDVLHILASQSTPYSKLHFRKILAGWEGLITGNLQLEYRACDHDALIREPIVASVASSIASHHRAIRERSLTEPGATPGMVHPAENSGTDQGSLPAAMRSGAQSSPALATSQP
jgi:thioesterase domain-containing protein